MIKFPPKGMPPDINELEREVRMNLVRVGPDPWAPIEYESGYPEDEDFGHFGRDFPENDFWRAAHWLLAELPRAADVDDAQNETTGKPVKRIKFSTGGWSGAESVIALIERRFDMCHFMYSWKRGGHFVFEIPTRFLKFASMEEASSDGEAGSPVSSRIPPEQGRGR
ncbi:MAG TPA: hypothetical protein VFS91_00055 [Nitrobacter sp.]|nr:hypothetical protein [Nitrobacter sp.]